MKKIRILLAALLILAMMAPMAMADEEEKVPAAVTQTQTIIGKGSYADPSAANVWSIKLPTADVVSFTIDPQKLVYQTKSEEEWADEVEDKFYSSATVIFTNYSSDGETILNYSSELMALEVENQGTKDVIVALNIRPTKTNMIIEQSSASIDASAKNPILLFRAKESSDSGYTVVPAVGLNLSSEIAAKTDAFTVTGDTTNGFSYAVNEEVTGADDFKWKSAKFSIDAEANDNDAAQWTGDLTAPNLELTWYIRNKSVEALPVEIASNVANGTKYVMAADRMYALPSETVTVYVQPAYADDASPAGYMVDTDPSGIETATKNYYTGEVSEKSSDFVTFSNGVNTDNGMMKYVFNVPGEDGFQGFSMEAKEGGSNVDNKINITGIPVIKKVVITASSQ